MYIAESDKSDLADSFDQLLCVCVRNDIIFNKQTSFSSSIYECSSITFLLELWESISAPATNKRAMARTRHGCWQLIKPRNKVVSTVNYPEDGFWCGRVLFLFLSLSLLVSLFLCRDRVSSHPPGENEGA